MGYKIAVIVLMALVTLVIGQIPQGGPHQNQGGGHVSQGGPHVIQHIRRQLDQLSQNDDDEVDTLNQGAPVWTNCNITVDSRISCADCNTRLICKPVGGLLKECNNPYRSHCNNGICAAVPNSGCV